MRLLTCHPLITFGWMLLSAMVFGLCSYNLFSLLKADIDLIVDYGFMALMDGTFKQLVMLFMYGIISLCAYLIFKACEHILVDWLIKPAAKEK